MRNNEKYEQVWKSIENVEKCFPSELSGCSKGVPQTRRYVEKVEEVEEVEKVSEGWRRFDKVR